MLFSATYACPACMLRFARRARCPGCGGGGVLSLRGQSRRGDHGGALAAIADWVRALFGLAGRPRTFRVHAAPWPSESAGGATTLRGVVRLASISVESPIAGTPCVAFGLHGDVDGAPIDDAEGGDFDLELESGERVMVSLEHAILVDEGAAAPSVVTPTPYLEELLNDRALGVEEGGASVVRLAEVLVLEGDVVTIEAEVSGGATLSFGESARASSRVRVAAGDEANPLVVRLGAG